MASPGVTKSANGKNFGSFSTLAEIEKIENYVYGIKPPTVEELKSRARKLVTDSKDIELAAVVFVSEYRPGAETVRKYHADVCFSRTGVARVGTKEPLYNSKVS